MRDASAGRRAAPLHLVGARLGQLGLDTRQRAPVDHVARARRRAAAGARHAVAVLRARAVGGGEGRRRGARRARRARLCGLLLVAAPRASEHRRQHQDHTTVTPDAHAAECTRPLGARRVGIGQGRSCGGEDSLCAGGRGLAENEDQVRHPRIVAQLLEQGGDLSAVMLLVVEELSRRSTRARAGGLPSLRRARRYESGALWRGCGEMAVSCLRAARGRSARQTESGARCSRAPWHVPCSAMSACRRMRRPFMQRIESC